MPQDAPVVQAARERGIEVTGELELAWRLIPNDFCAVTGTNGKTTTTELIGHLYRTAGRPVAVAGNVGTPLASLVGAVDPEATVVCEASSFQLEDTDDFAPECAVFVNIAPDHLDRHGTLEDYLAAKLRIFANQGNDDVAVYNGETRSSRGGTSAAAPAGSASAPPRRTAADPDCELSLRDGVDLRGRRAADPRRRAAAARGPQRRERDGGGRGGARLRPCRATPSRRGCGASRACATASSESASATGSSTSTTRRRPTSPRPLAGIRAFDGRRPPDRSAAGQGGELRAAGAGRCAERCVAVYLIGEAAERLARELAPAAEAGVEITDCGTLERAVEAAAAEAKPGEVVLLSPACASFDAFRDFEERGDRFRELVRRSVSSRGRSAAAHEDSRKPAPPPLEYSLLLTATLCLLAFGAVMVFSASSATLAAQQRRQRLLLPRAHADLRRDRPAGDADRIGARGRRGPG